MSDDATKLAILEQEVHRHSEQLEDLSDKFKDLGFMVKTYTENMIAFDKKIDNLTSIVEELKPNRTTWEWEQRVIMLEKKQRVIDKYKNYGILAIIGLALITIIPNIVLMFFDHYLKGLI